MLARTAPAAVLVAASGFTLADTLTPTNLTVEYATTPIGIEAATPRLSWQSESEVRDSLQSAYQITAAYSEADLSANKSIWDTGKVSSSDSLFIDYTGPKLGSGERVYWRVKLWDKNGDASDWSSPSYWEMGLLAQSDWQPAQWIKSTNAAEESENRPASLFRGKLTLKDEIESARLYVTAQGLYEVEINGQAITDQLFTPGWTSYNHQIQYQTYDVAGFLAEGTNTVAAQLADGWYRGYLGWSGQRNIYGDETALKAKLIVTYGDGSKVELGTDETWLTSNSGPIRGSDIYNGETYDARLSNKDWSAANFDDSAWQNAQIKPVKSVELIAPQSPGVRAQQELNPKKISKAPDGSTIVDFGQNLVGVLRLQAKGEAGHTVTLRYAEVLGPEGNIYTDNLRAAKQTDQFILAGAGEESFTPKFTFHGFRYVAINNYPGELNEDNITAIVVHSDMDRTGHWQSSDDLLNQLYSNIIWGQKGNFLDVPTDCPQRDERLGWTGDAQVFAATAALNMNVSGFFAKWLDDLATDQLDNGSVPFVIPNVLGDQDSGTAGWGDAATVIPWEMYQAYGDTKILANQFDSMKAWVDYMGSQAQEDLIWRPVFQFGDWLAPVTNPMTATTYKAITGVDLIATAYYAHSANLVAQAAEVLGKKREAKTYSKLFNTVKNAFYKEFFTADGRVVYETQTAYVLALAFDLVPESKREAIAKRLDQQVQQHGDHLTTGFLGTPDLLASLSSEGYYDRAYALLTQTTYPSWLYPVTFGATTIWEHWDAILPDGTFQNPEMTSFNHYAYGAVGRWMVNEVAGLDRNQPAYKQARIAPKPGGGLHRAQASLQTPYGPLASQWHFDGDEFTLAVTVPANTSAEVVLPNAANVQASESGKAIKDAEGVISTKTLGEDLVLTIGSGSYRFSYESHDLSRQASNLAVLDEATPMQALLAAQEVQALLKESAPSLLARDFKYMSIAGKTLAQAATDFPELAGPLGEVSRNLEDINTQRWQGWIAKHKQ
ncbi:glycoside hydrolase family 78 protein [Halioxenophilus aromaticivorans]|uniref:alpha-L-rhamnosidase n=1 Tax=Halioxenophilus aromaticivorans TaxID=1306992 RepID=A0AAV3UA58_9ALTE